MQTDGALMRLDKRDFQNLLTEPILEWLDLDEASEVVSNGGQWLDVRLPSEYETAHRDGAVNIPLYILRLKLNTLNPDTHYVVSCDTGRRSSAAAFILNENESGRRSLRVSSPRDDLRDRDQHPLLLRSRYIRDTYRDSVWMTPCY